MHGSDSPWADHLGTDIRDLKDQPAFLLSDHDEKPRSLGLKDPVSEPTSSSPQPNRPVVSTFANLTLKTPVSSAENRHQS